MKHNPEKHHHRSIRLLNYDYTQPGAYFLTICTYNQVCSLGEITDGEMHLSLLGHIVAREWQRLLQRFPGIELDAFVIMPNHLHGIIVIKEQNEENAPCTGTALNRPDQPPSSGTGTTVKHPDLLPPECRGTTVNRPDLLPPESSRALLSGATHVSIPAGEAKDRTEEVDKDGACGPGTGVDGHIASSFDSPRAPTQVGPAVNPLDLSPPECRGTTVNHPDLLPPECSRALLSGATNAGLPDGEPQHGTGEIAKEVASGPGTGVDGRMASSFNSPRAPTNVGRPGDPHQPASEDAEGAQTKEKFGRPVPGSIPTIVRSFKSSVTTRVNSASDHPPAPFW